jgi:hypothetical protein
VLEGLAERLAGILHDSHGIAHDEASKTGAADDDKLERLEKSVEMATHGHEAADDAAHRNHKSDNNIHRQSHLIVIFTGRDRVAGLREADGWPRKALFLRDSFAQGNAVRLGTTNGRASPVSEMPPQREA